MSVRDASLGLLLVAACTSEPSSYSSAYGLDNIAADTSNAIDNNDTTGTTDLSGEFLADSADSLGVDAVSDSFGGTGRRPASPMPSQFSVSCSCAPRALIERIDSSERTPLCTARSSFSPCYLPLESCVFINQSTRTDVPCSPAFPCSGTVVAVADGFGKTSTTSVPIDAPGKRLYPGSMSLEKHDLLVAVTCHSFAPAACEVPGVIEVVEIPSAPDEPGVLQASGVLDMPSLPLPTVLDEAIDSFGAPLDEAQISIENVDVYGPLYSYAVPSAQSSQVLGWTRGTTLRRHFAVVLRGVAMPADASLGIDVIGRLNTGETSLSLPGPLSADILLGIVSIGQCRHLARFTPCVTPPGLAPMWTSSSPFIASGASACEL